MLQMPAIEQLIEAQMKERGVAGFALAVIRGEETVYARGFGVTSVGTEVPVTTKTLFRIASNTKAMTGAMIMRLVEAGKSALDVPIRIYIPWFELHTAEAAEKVTLRMLLTHTAGLPNGGDFSGNRNPEGLEQFVRNELPKLPMVADPGLIYSYSNYGICVAGLVAEVVCDKPYTQVMQEWVFDPLHMHDTTFDPLVALTYTVAQDHVRDPDGNLRVQHQFYDNTAIYPSSYAMTTILDLATFATMHLNEGRSAHGQFLTPETIADMRHVHADWYNADGEGAGLTVLLNVYKGLRRHWHTGGLGGYTSTMVWAPDVDLAVVTTANGDMGWDIMDAVFDHLLDLPDQAPQPQAIEPNRALWPQMIGSYLGFRRGFAEVKVEDDQLIVNHNGTTAPLYALRDDLYVTKNHSGEVALSLGFPMQGAQEPVSYLILDGGPCKRLESGRAEVPTEQLQPLLGTYTKDGMTFTFSLKEGEPAFTDDGAEYSVFVIDSRRFTVNGYGLLEFEPAPDGTYILAIQGNWRFPRIQKEVTVPFTSPKTI